MTLVSFEESRKRRSSNSGTRAFSPLRSCSYTFRPRKKSKRSNPRIIKYYHALKALALREKRIYVVGKPELTITGTPVILTSKERPIATPTISLE